ncbi:HNH endonuclease [Escherichia coli]
MEREYLTESQRSSLFSNCSNTCATCGKTVAAGVRGLQADHKIPLSRGGGNELTNWQALCHNCNVGKRRACEGCTEDCYTCSHNRRYLTSTTNNRHVATKPKLNSTSSVPIFLIHLFSAECVCYLQRTQCILRTKNHVNR